MTPDDEEANAARPLRWRKFTAEQAGDAIQEGNCEVMALYIRQMLRTGAYDFHFLKWLADLLDPHAGDRVQLVSKGREKGQPSDEIEEIVRGVQIAMMVRDDIAIHSDELLKECYGRVAQSLGVSDKTVSKAYVKHRGSLAEFAQQTQKEK